MKTYKLMPPLLAAFTLLAISDPGSRALGAPKPPPIHVELRMTGAVWTLPDHTANVEFDQCREAGLSSTSHGQRKTTMDLSALGLGDHRGSLLIDFGTKTARVGAQVSISTWLTKNCQLLVEGEIESGEWPLSAGSPGDELVVLIPAGAVWTYNRFGGGASPCTGAPSAGGDVRVAIRRNDARTGNVCDCPFDYTDAEAAACP